MKKIIFLFLTLIIKSSLAQVPAVYQSISSEVVYVSATALKSLKEDGEAIPKKTNYWANSKIAYNFVGNKDAIENILVDANILFNAYTFSKNFYLPIMGNITPPNSDLVIDSFKQSIESILLQNDGLNIGIYPCYTMNPDFNALKTEKTNFSVTVIGKVRINGLQDSANMNIDKLYTGEVGANALFQFRGFDVSPEVPAEIDLQISYQNILNSESTFNEKFKSFTSDGRKSWFVLSSYLIFPVLKDGLGLAFNYKIATGTTGVFTAGFIFAKGL